MKKIKSLLIILISLIFVPNVFASSGKITVSSAGTVVVGNSVTVTVTLSSGSNIGSWEMLLNYDTNYLTLTSSTSEANNNKMVNSSSGIKSKTYTFTFKTKKTGSTTLAVNNYDIYDFEENNMTISSSGRTIKIITQAELEASYSKNNNLKSLSVEGYELTPEFNADTLEYNLSVNEDTKTIKVNAAVADSTARVTGAGDLEVSPGSNKFDIVVTAQNGSEKTYTINVDVIDKNPINVTVGNENYTVVKMKENLTMPSSFTESTITISDTEVPCFINDTINFTLVGLKDTNGNINLYIYDNGNYTLYKEITSGNITIYPYSINETINNYAKDTLDINNITTDVLVVSDRYYLINGINVITGEEGLFLYDKKDNTLIKYDNTEISNLNNKIKTFTYLLIAIFVALFISIVCIITLLTKKRKKVKPIIDEKINNEDNEIKELDNNMIAIDEEEPIVEQKEKTKKKKKTKKDKE